MIRLVTDSGAQLTPQLRERFEVEVAPMGIVVDGRDHREGVDLTTTEFYARMADGASVGTSAPSPGDLLAAYQRAADAGATAIVSIHTGSSISATVGSATVAAGMAPVGVHVVDTGVASFLVSLCVWAAGEALAAGSDVAGVVTAASAAAQSTGSVFVVGVADRAVDGGRFAAVDTPISATSVLELGPSGMRELCKVASVDAAIEAMAEHVAGLGAHALGRIAVGDAQRRELGDELAARVVRALGGADITRYDIGPSVGVHTGAGSIGVVWSAT